MGHKAADTTHDIGIAFGRELLTDIQCSGGSRSFAKESLEDECNGQPSEVDNDQFRGSLKLILLQLHEKLPKNSTSTILWLFGI